MQVQNLPVHLRLIGHLTAFYNYVKPTAVALMQNQQISNAVTSSALIAIGAFGNMIGQWLGFYSPSPGPVLEQLKKSFPAFALVNQTNTHEVVKKIKELAKNFTQLASEKTSLTQVYNIVKTKTENLLQSSNTNNDVKKSLIKAGLDTLPKLNLDNVANVAVSLSNWIHDTGVCHKDKLLVSGAFEKEQQEKAGLRKELSSCKKELSTSKSKVEKLSIDSATCEIKKQICSDSLHNCEHKGFLKRTFCWLN